MSISTSGSPFLCLSLSLSSNSLSLSLPKLSPDSTQEVTEGSWTPNLAAQALVSPCPHPRRICRRLCGRFSAGRIALLAGCRRSCTSGLQDGAHAWVWLEPAFLGAGSALGSGPRTVCPTPAGHAPQAPSHLALPSHPSIGPPL